MSWTRIRALMRKDLKALSASPMVLAPMVIVPALLCILIPAALTLAALRLGELLVSGAQYIERLLVPVMASTIIAANSIVGEKERHTLETLLHTPLSNRELLTAKLLVAFLPAALVS
jgi:ABC-2 type transport system permease protein